MLNHHQSIYSFNNDANAFVDLSGIVTQVLLAAKPEADAGASKSLNQVPVFKQEEVHLKSLTKVFDVLDRWVHIHWTEMVDDESEAVSKTEATTSNEATINEAKAHLDHLLTAAELINDELNAWLLKQLFDKHCLNRETAIRKAINVLSSSDAASSSVHSGGEHQHKLEAESSQPHRQKSTSSTHDPNADKKGKAKLVSHSQGPSDVDHGHQQKSTDGASQKKLNAAENVELFAHHSDPRANPSTSNTPHGVQILIPTQVISKSIVPG